MMSASSKHIIGRLQLDVALSGNEGEGLTLQQRLSNQCQGWLIPALNRILEQHAFDGYLCIDLLKIDAGTLPIDRLETDLAEQVARALDRAMRLQNLPGNLSPAVLSRNFQHKTVQQSVQEALLYFLHTGRLPWSFRVPENMTFEQLFSEHIQNGFSVTGWLAPEHPSYHALVQLLSGSAAARQRLCWQFPDHFLHTLLKCLSPRMHHTLEFVLAKLHQAVILPAERTVLVEKLWQNAYAKILSPAYYDAILLFTETFQLVSGSIQQSGQAVMHHAIRSVWPGLPPLNGFPGATAGSQAGSSSKKDPAQRTGNPETGTGAAPGSSNTHEVRKRGQRETGQQPGSSKTNDLQEPEQGGTHLQADGPVPDAALTPDPTVAADGIYINNAGLVLLHPFLPMLFEELKLSDGQKLLQPYRALCLLHFLVSGKNAAPEYELDLPKVLCNIPLETPVMADIVLKQEEKEEAAALLQAVIRHWEALRNTSPDGLRGTFLLRAGKLSVRSDNDWLLQVEPQSVDILLDQLPWGISMIRLPWMRRMLWVEWR